jgi:hypothetical protein
VELLQAVDIHPELRTESRLTSFYWAKDLRYFRHTVSDLDARTTKWRARSFCETERLEPRQFIYETSLDTKKLKTRDQIEAQIEET